MNGLGIKAICFDYYGTLVDIGQPFVEIRKWFEAIILREKRKISIDEFNMSFTRQRAKYTYDNNFMTGYDLLEKSYINTCGKYGLNSYTMEFNLFISNLFSTAIAYKDAIDTINKLKQKYTLGLITNADNDVLYKSIQNQGFQFDFVISSEDAKFNKPRREIFDYALEKLELLPDKVLMVGDSLVDDIFAAKSLGINTIWINRSNSILYKNTLQIKDLNEILQYTLERQELYGEDI